MRISGASSMPMQPTGSDPSRSSIGGTGVTFPNGDYRFIPSRMRGAHNANTMRALLHKQYSLHEAEEATTSDPGKAMPLGELFDGEPAVLKPVEDDWMISIDTRLADVSAERRAEDVSDNKGIVKFYTYMSPRVLYVDSAYKDRDLTTGFNMTDAIDMQRRMARIDGDFEFLIQRNIHSREGLRFFQQYHFNDEDEMDEAELGIFLNGNPNGKSSARLAAKYYKTIDYATVLKQTDPDANPEEPTFRDSSYSVVFALTR
jgi:hypothetical protein